MTSCALAQTDAKGLENALKGKQFELRSFSADRTARYTWSDGKLVDTPARVRTLGVFSPTSVKLRGQKLSIVGLRGTLIRNTKKNALGVAGRSEMELQIDLNGADAVAVLPQLPDLLFFPNAAAAVAALPAPVVSAVPASVPPVSSPDPCECNRFLRGGEWVNVPKDDPKLKQPNLTYLQHPEYSEDARNAKLNGTVRFMFLVEPTGKPSDLWLAAALGHGLDESAEDALRNYRFTPATYDGQPVAVELMVEVTFQIF